MHLRTFRIVAYLLASFIVLTLCTAWTIVLPEPVQAVYFAGKPIVRGSLNGKEAFFLLDTGSDLSILHTRMARTYGFAISSKVYRRPIHGIQGETNFVKPIRHANLTLGGHALETSFKGMDIGPLVASIRRKTTFQIAGIIGVDVLMRYGFAIDFQQRQVTFLPPEPEAPVIPPTLVKSQ